MTTRETKKATKLPTIRVTSSALVKANPNCSSLNRLRPNITGTARGITETGCKFPLDNGEIRCDYQYGTSNEVLPGQTAVVSVKEGNLLLIRDFPE